MAKIGPEHTYWTPSKDGGISRVYYGDPSWATIAYWAGDLPDLKTEQGREWLCSQLSKAFETGRDAQAELTRRVIFHGRPLP